MYICTKICFMHKHNDVLYTTELHTVSQQFILDRVRNGYKF